MDLPAPIKERPPLAGELAGRRVRLIGRFASVPRQEAAAAVERRGGQIDEASPDWIVLGEGSSASDHQLAATAAAESHAECLDECELWRRLGLVDDQQGVSRLYSPAMLGELVGAPLEAIRRWTRRGTLRPVRWVNQLAYFDFAEARIAQLLAEAFRQRPSLPAIDRVVDRLSASHPGLERPLAELPLIAVEGELLLRSADALAEVSGQRCFDFEAPSDSEAADDAPTVLSLASVVAPQRTSLRERAWELCDSGRLDEAIEAWRLVMLESYPTADDQFTLAEWLYQQGEHQAARERYYSVLELDGEHLEARVNLGCVLVDLGEFELALASLNGALEQHEGFADAHYHLARAYQSRGESEAAEPHWRRFLEIAPESPWAVEARERLGLHPTP
ncbi:cellulose synthase subunit BcsC [Planctomycetes bacterium MalM25]|nr:cellulose synthase subunit BcsC [Planctomycetes bacterium MalM25]